MTKPATVSDVLHLTLTSDLSTKKKIVEANIMAVASQNENTVKLLRSTILNSVLIKISARFARLYFKYKKYSKQIKN